MLWHAHDQRELELLVDPAVFSFAQVKPCALLPATRDVFVPLAMRGAFVPPTTATTTDSDSFIIATAIVAAMLC